METDVVESPVPASTPLPPSLPAAELPLETADHPTDSSSQSSQKKASWTPERRAALSEKMKQRHREQSAFALTDDHEFPVSPQSFTVKDPQFNTQKVIPKEVVLDIVFNPPPALPGTPSSPFRRCSCLGVLPGRVCTFCYGTKWTKLCSKCEGEGRIHLAVRKGAERSQPCGHCGGKGTLPANMKAIAEATRAAEGFAAATASATASATAGQNGHSLPSASDESAPEFRRAVKLPGIGVTSKKRMGTLAARKREGQRNAARKAKRKASGQASRQAIAS